MWSYCIVKHKMPNIRASLTMKRKMMSYFNNSKMRLSLICFVRVHEIDFQSNCRRYCCITKLHLLHLRTYFNLVRRLKPNGPHPLMINYNSKFSSFFIKDTFEMELAKNVWSFFTIIAKHQRMLAWRSPMQIYSMCFLPPVPFGLLGGDWQALRDANKPTKCDKIKSSIVNLAYNKLQNEVEVCF